MKIRLGKFCRRFFVLLFFFFASIYASIIAHGWLMRHWEKDENNESERGEGWKEILSTVRSLLDISVCRVMSTRFDTFPRLDIFLIVYRYLRSIAGSKYKILPLFFFSLFMKIGRKNFHGYQRCIRNIYWNSIDKFFFDVQREECILKIIFSFFPNNLGISW